MRPDGVAPIRPVHPFPSPIRSSRARSYVRIRTRYPTNEDPPVHHRITVTLFAVTALVLGACGGDDGPDSAATTVPEATATAEPTSGTADGEATVDGMTFTTCETEAFTIRYPQDWWTNPADAAPECRMYHPEPTEVQGESLHYAVQTYVDDVEFERVTDDEGPDETLFREETTVDGRAAVVTEARASGDTLAPEGTRRYSYVIDLDGRILVVVTHSVGDTDYERDKAVLDRMVTTLELRPDDA